VQVLFCTLSPAQRKLYRAYLSSRDVSEILEGKRPSMEGITMLRKICNHADLVQRAELADDPGVAYGALDRSAKLAVTMQARAASGLPLRARVLTRLYSCLSGLSGST
jgi:DNA excision repair protein ERCC-6